MNINEFIEERKGEWERLEALSARFRPGSANRLSRDELWELGRLYLAVVSDLALVRSSEFASEKDHELTAYLNGLAARVHGRIHRTAPFRWSSVWRFLAFEFPRTVRRTWPYLAISTSVFALFGVAGFVTALTRPDFMELVLSDHVMSSVENGDVWFKGLFAVAPQASGFLMTHNITVTFLVVAAGITFGAGTVYLLALNGLFFGTAAALCALHGLSVPFWSFVLPHGSLELTAVFISGGAGLIIGHALVDPGRFRRSEYLSIRGNSAARLALGCVPLLVVAGFIEAFLSPSPLPPLLKFGIAVLLCGSLAAFFVFAGVNPDHRPSREDRTHPEHATGLQAHHARTGRKIRPHYPQ